MIEPSLRIVKISSLRLPGNFEALVADPFVLELSNSIDAHGMIHPPVIDKDTMEPIAGLHRIAAAAAKKQKEIEVRVFRGTPEERELLTIAENLHRKHRDQSSLRARYVEIKARQIAAEPQPAAREAGRPATPKSIAIKQASKEIGVSEQQLRADLRAKEAQSAEPPPDEVAAQQGGDGVKRTSSVIETYGQDVSDFRLSSIESLREIHEQAASKLSQAISVIAGAKQSSLPCDEEDLNTVVEMLRAAADLLRSRKPHALCSTCITWGDNPQCPSCFGRGWVHKAAAKSAPEPR